MTDKEITWITAWPLSSYYAAYIDPRKSLPHQNDRGQWENRPGYAFWIPENRYLSNEADYFDVIGSLECDEYTFNDPVLNRPLIRFRVEAGHTAMYDGQPGNGMILFQYTPDLMSCRKRDDGLLGIESISGLLDTRLSSAELIKSPQKFPTGIIHTNKKEANFSNFARIEEKIKAEMAAQKKQDEDALAAILKKQKQEQEETRAWEAEQAEKNK